MGGKCELGFVVYLNHLERSGFKLGKQTRFEDLTAGFCYCLNNFFWYMLEGVHHLQSLQGDRCLFLDGLNPVMF